MSRPDFERAKRYALERLEHELPPSLSYHTITHTRDDVAPAVERLAATEGVQGEDLLLLRTAAFYHDLGFVERYADNEEIGVRLAAEVLPHFGYTPEQIQIISGIIIATKLPQTPHTLLEKIMADADLDILGQNDFWIKNDALRAELAVVGMSTTIEKWYAEQLDLMKSHRYFTASARAMRDAGKQKNIETMAQLLARCQASSQNNHPPTKKGEGNMHSTKVAILRSVSIFAETPDDILSQVANLLQPLELQAGETVFSKGDRGDSMYIIVEGRVRVHDGEMLLNYLGAADVFGEMAVLDEQPRLATVTAIEATRLFRLDQASFYALMDNQPEVARGIIRVLNRHLRGRVRDMAQDFLYIQQMSRLTAAAAALEAGMYDPRSLDEVCRRTDELGQLARVFQRMANEVVAREQRLKQELQQLRIQIDEAKRARQVAEITETEYFQQLQQKVKQIRKEG